MGNLAEAFLGEIAGVLSDPAFKRFVLRDRLQGALAYALELDYRDVIKWLHLALDALEEESSREGE